MGDAALRFQLVATCVQEWMRICDRRTRIQRAYRWLRQPLSASSWPVEGTTFEKFYLHSGGDANSLAGDGSLTRIAPGREPADDFVYAFPR